MAELLSEKVKEQIEKKIYDGVYQNGYIFTSERFLASEYMVSRTVIRKALHILESNKLVEAVGHGKYRVTFINDDIVAKALKQLLLSNVTSFMDIVELREILEVAIAERAILYINDESYKKMEDIWRLMEHYKDNKMVNSFLEADREFHMSLARLIPNPMFHILLETVFQTDINTFALTKTLSTAMEDAQHEHEMILTGLKLKNSIQTRSAMQTHFVNIRYDFYRMSADVDSGVLE